MTSMTICCLHPFKVLLRTIFSCNLRAPPCLLSLSQLHICTFHCIYTNVRISARFKLFPSLVSTFLVNSMLWVTTSWISHSRPLELGDQMTSTTTTLHNHDVLYFVLPASSPALCHLLCLDGFRAIFLEDFLLKSSRNSGPLRRSWPPYPPFCIITIASFSASTPFVHLLGSIQSSQFIFWLL